MFVTKIIPLVENSILQPENIHDIKCYLDQEVEMSKKSSLIPSKFQQKKYPFLYDTVRKLIIDHELTDEQIDVALNNHLESYNSINPTLEILEIINNLLTNTPEHCAIIQIIYNEVVLGSISVTVDQRLTLFGAPVAYMIGIRKSIALFTTQHLHLSPELTNFKLSDYLISAVTKYGLERKAEYVVVTPINPMLRILEKYHGFKKEPTNIMEIKYEPSCFLMGCKEESIHWKKVDLII